MSSPRLFFSYFIFFFNDTATTEIYTLSLHDALPIFVSMSPVTSSPAAAKPYVCQSSAKCNSGSPCDSPARFNRQRDRKSTRLNSSHSQISYAVFCLKKKKKQKKKKK